MKSRKVRVVDSDGAGAFIFKLEGNRVVKIEKCASRKTTKA